ncbi:hypothetical protein BDZ45DRAFT_804707 [Acephala macrosclerotiorum]|nr:hypothetical protein BDZ45DRAFT_804707 [Acephala macrosclerotiorum]
MYSFHYNIMNLMLLLILLSTSAIAQSTTISPTFDDPSLYVPICISGLSAGLCEHIYHLGCDQTGTLVNTVPVSDAHGDYSSISCSCIPVNNEPSASGTPAAEIDPAFSSIQSFIAENSVAVMSSTTSPASINFSRVPTSMPRIKTKNDKKRNEDAYTRKLKIRASLVLAISLGLCWDLTVSFSDKYQESIFREILTISFWDVLDWHESSCGDDEVRVEYRGSTVGVC